MRSDSATRFAHLAAATHHLEALRQLGAGERCDAKQEADEQRLLLHRGALPGRRNFVRRAAGARSRVSVALGRPRWRPATWRPSRVLNSAVPSLLEIRSLDPRVLVDMVLSSRRKRIRGGLRGRGGGGGCAPGTRQAQRRNGALLQGSGFTFRYRGRGGSATPLATASPFLRRMHDERH
jgi:hypothetical protein